MLTILSVNKLILLVVDFHSSSSKAMKYFLILIFAFKVLSFPIPNEQIIFPDQFKEFKQMLLDDFKANQMNLVNDSNILMSDNMTIEFLIDPDGFKNFEDGEYFQGDMVMLDEQLNILNDSTDMTYRTGIIGEKYRWPKNSDGKVIVPYEISDHFGWKDKARIKLAMYGIEKFTCIEFQTRTDQSDYINIISGYGCHSHVGKINGAQRLSLRIGGCLARGTIIHELMHALGFDHMHNHVDRDEFVEIQWDNVKHGAEQNFKKVDSRLFGNFGTPYDYYSVMHYGLKYFSKNKRPTMVPKDSSKKKIIGNRVALSVGDAERLNAMYKCNGPPNTSYSLRFFSWILT